MAQVKIWRYQMAGALLTVWEKLNALHMIKESLEGEYRDESKFSGDFELWTCESFIELWNKPSLTPVDEERFRKIVESLVLWDILPERMLDQVAPRGTRPSARGARGAGPETETLIPEDPLDGNLVTGLKKGLKDVDPSVLARTKKIGSPLDRPKGEGGRGRD